jgi:hypothetical protein
MGWTVAPETSRSTNADGAEGGDRSRRRSHPSSLQVPFAPAGLSALSRVSVAQTLPLPRVPFRVNRSAERSKEWLRVLHNKEEDPKTRADPSHRPSMMWKPSAASCSSSPRTIATAVRSRSDHTSHGLPAALHSSAVRARSTVSVANQVRTGENLIIVHAHAFVVVPANSHARYAPLPRFREDRGFARVSGAR